jgi:hypothetical protein
MAITTMKGCVPYPIHPNINIAGVAPNTGSDNLDNTADRCASIFQVTKTGSISEINFAVGSVTGLSGSVTLDVRIETIDGTTGFPTGTLWGTTTNGSVSVAFNDDNTWQTATLTSAASVTEGDYIAVVFNPTAFTTVTAVQILRFLDQTMLSAYSAADLTGGGYAKAASVHSLIVGYNDGSYEPICGIWPVLVVTTLTYNSGSGNPKAGAKITVPFPCSIDGAWIWYNPTGTSSDLDIKLYASDGTTVRASKSIDANMLSATTIGIYYFLFTSSYTAAAGDVLYLSIEPTTANNISLYHSAAPSNAKLDGFPGGKNFFLSTNNGSAWSDTDTARPMIGLLMSGFSDGAGSGGSANYYTSFF